MEPIKRIFGREPALWQAAVLAIINLLVVFGIWNIDATQVGAINTALAAVLGLIVRQAVTPLADPKVKIDGQKVKLVPER